MELRQVAQATVVVLGVTAGGLSMIAKHEGLSHKAYPDAAYGWAMPTICHGHTVNVKRGDTATPAMCQDWLKQDADSAFAFLKHSLPNVQLSQGEVNGYTSLTFNLKRSAWLQSSARKELLKPDGDRYAACLYATRFVLANGKPLRGLAYRRYDEYNECISTLDAPYLHELLDERKQWYTKSSPPSSVARLWPWR